MAFCLCDQDAQQSDMMDLEIADYERTVHALNAQLSDRDSQITSLKAEISRVQERIQLMQTQISMCLFVAVTIGRHCLLEHFDWLITERKKNDSHGKCVMIIGRPSG